jgi:hypothetical protein
VIIFEGLRGLKGVGRGLKNLEANRSLNKIRYIYIDNTIKIDTN